MSKDGFLPQLRGSKDEDGEVDAITTLKTTLERREEQINKLKQRVEELEEELEENETEMVIRSESEPSDIPADGLIDLREALTRAVEMDVTPQNAEALKDGLEATRAQLDALMADLGVTTINPTAGSQFDERQHKAIGAVETEGPSGTINSIERVGYKHNGDVIRRAHVVVNGSSYLVEQEE